MRCSSARRFSWQQFSQSATGAFTTGSCTGVALLAPVFSAVVLNLTGCAPSGDAGDLFPPPPADAAVRFVINDNTDTPLIAAISVRDLGGLFLFGDRDADGELLQLTSAVLRIDQNAPPPPAGEPDLRGLEVSIILDNYYPTQVFTNRGEQVDFTYLGSTLRIDSRDANGNVQSFEIDFELLSIEQIEARNDALFNTQVDIVDPASLEGAEGQDLTPTPPVDPAATQPARAARVGLQTIVTAVFVTALFGVGVLFVPALFGPLAAVGVAVTTIFLLGNALSDAGRFAQDGIRVPPGVEPIDDGSGFGVIPERPTGNFGIIPSGQ